MTDTAIADIFAGRMGEAEGLRWALIAAACVGLLSGVLFLMARKTIRQDLEDV